MQCTSYLPGCYSTRDLNVGANDSTWSLYNNDTTWKGGHGYNVLLPQSTTTQYSGYDKEVLKQTMLKHEATFRDQVHELHRLYRRQRELMDEIERREMSKQLLQLQTSQSNSFLPQIPSEFAPKSWHIPSLPWVNPATSKPSALSAENFQAPSNFVAGKSIQAGPDPSLIKSSSKDCESLSSKSMKSGRRILDLELPADEFIDSKEGEKFEEEKVSKVPEVPCSPLKRSDILPKSDPKLFLCSGGFNSVCQGGSSSPDTFFRKTNDLVDLNEPIQLEEGATPNSINLMGSDTSPVEIPYQDQVLSGKPNSGIQVLSKEIFRSIQVGKDLEGCSEIINLEKEKRQRQLLPHNDEAGISGSNLNSLLQVSSQEKSPMSCLGKISERIHDLSTDNYPRMVGSCIPTLYQLVPQSEVPKSEPCPVSSQRKPIRNLRQIPIVVQALPCLNTPALLSKSSKSSVGNPGLDGNKFQLNSNSKNIPSFGSVNSLQYSLFPGQSESMTLKTCPLSTSLNPLNYDNENDLTSEHHDLTKCFHSSDCMGVNSAKDMDLNFMPPSCLPDMTVSQENVRTTDGEKKLKDSTGGLHWLRAKPDFNGNLNKEMEDLFQMESGKEDLAQMESGIFSQAFPTFVCNVEPKRFGTGDCPGNKRTIGSSSFSKSHISGDHCSALTFPCGSHPNPFENRDIENSEKVGVLDIGLAYDPTLNSGKCSKDDLAVKIGVVNKLSGFQNHIDLNSCINEDQSTPSVASVVMKTAAEIDLEAPVSPENKECSPPRVDSEEHQLEIPLQLSKQEDGDPQGELVRIAAEAIVSISSSGAQLFLDNSTCEPLVASRDSLQWFAGIVSSMAGDPENELGIVLSGAADGDHNELFPNGIDFFEVMTLNLTETKVEEYCCPCNGQKEKETAAILLPSQPRRGRMRRARQRKDFQAEVLPCLASLSRHEVKEDFQTIGGLMEAAGTPLESPLGRRSSGRNGCARGKRRSSISPSNVVESTMCSLPKQQTNDGELDFGEGGLTGWGKINRRQRGQRFRASNPPPIF